MSAIDAGIHAIRAGRHLCDEALRYLWTGTSRRTHSAHAGHFYANPSHPTKCDTSGNAMPQRLHLLCVLVELVTQNPLNFVPVWPNRL